MHTLSDVTFINQDLPGTLFAMERCRLTDIRLLVSRATPPLKGCTLTRCVFYFDIPTPDVAAGGQDAISALWPALVAPDAKNTFVDCTVSVAPPLPRKARALRKL